MKVLWYLLTVAVSSAVFHQEYYPWKRTHLLAVTHFVGIEEFYLSHIRLQKSKSLLAERDHFEESSAVKKTICNKILNNHSLVEKEFWLNLDVEEVRRNFKKDDRDLYLTMYKKLDTSHRSCCTFGPVSREYVNPYVSITPKLPGMPMEHVFKCVARDNDTKAIVLYYVSEEYNVNIRREPFNNIKPDFITGRFVFTQDWQLLELAEESAVLTKEDYPYEEIYLQYRQGHEIVKEMKDDPVCGLDEGKIIRLCASMINTTEVTGIDSITPQFGLRYKNFKPETIGANTDCIKREVEFGFKTTRTYSEWTLSCTVQTKQNKEEIFHVSRGYKMNSIFVFRPKGDGTTRMIVDHHSGNVSVVDDPTIQTERRGPEEITY